MSELPLLDVRRRPVETSCTATEAVKRVCRKRAPKWSALLTQTKSHSSFNCGMKGRLGEANWSTFVQYAIGEGGVAHSCMTLVAMRRYLQDEAGRRQRRTRETHSTAEIHYKGRRSGRNGLRTSTGRLERGTRRPHLGDSE